MKIVVAPDSFKGSLSAQAAGMAIKRGIEKVLPKSDVIVVPMADGGEGTLQCLLDATQGRLIDTRVTNPIGKEITSSFGILGDGVTCVIEMAMASGLYLIDPQDRNPLLTTTYGLGELIKAALDHGCRHFIVGIGGSATNDGGAGMLQALGIDLLDIKNKPIGFGGGELQRLHKIDTDRIDPRLADSTFVVACDVNNPFVGPQGASHVFGPQKGATPTMVKRLDDNLRHFADQIEAFTRVTLHDVPGTGAAGGLAGAFLAFLNGKLKSGIDIVIEMTQLEKEINGADLVITGEGQIDYQTINGKTPYGVAQVAKKHGVPTIVLAGSIGEGVEQLYDHGITALVSIVNKPMPLEEAMAQTPDLLSHTAEQVIRIYTSSNGV
jgi:glycerate kinase